MESANKNMGSYLFCVTILMRILGIEPACLDIGEHHGVFIHSETNHYYYVFELNKEYIDAKIFCESYPDTHLVFLETASEFNWFHDKLEEINISDEIIVGAEMHHPSGKLFWVQGNQIMSEVAVAVMSFFTYYNPSDTDKDRVIFRNGDLKQIRKENNEDFICECEGDTGVTTLEQTTSKYTTAALEQTTPKYTTAALEQTTSKYTTAVVEQTTPKYTTAALEQTTEEKTTTALEETTTKYAITIALEQGTKDITTALEQTTKDTTALGQTTTINTTTSALEPSQKCSGGTYGSTSEFWLGRYQLVWSCIMGAEMSTRFSSSSVIYCARKCQTSQECFAFIQNVSVKKCVLLINGTSVYSSCTLPNICYIMV